MEGNSKKKTSKFLLILLLTIVGLVAASLIMNYGYMDMAPLDFNHDETQLIV